MFRIIRATTLTALHADRVELAATRTDLAVADAARTAAEGREADAQIREECTVADLEETRIELAAARGELTALRSLHHLDTEAGRNPFRSKGAEVRITSFGYLHCRDGLCVPPAHVVLDLREHFRDPHVAPELRHMTARDQAVHDAVLGTPGIPELVTATAATVRAYQAGPSAGPVRVAVGCAGGRHRAPVVALAVARVLRLGQDWEAVTVMDRDIGRPVVAR